MDKLIRHFTAIMVLITSTGVSVATVRRMGIAHAQVANHAGIPITGPVYDSVIDILVQVLTEAGVPDTAINELARTVAPLREAIVAQD